MLWEARGRRMGSVFTSVVVDHELGLAYDFLAVEQAARKIRNLGPIGSVELLHDVADVDLYGALPHVELVGDDFVRLAAPERLDDRSLACGEHAVGFVYGRRRIFLHPMCSDEAAGRDINAAGSSQLHRLYRNVDRQARWNIASDVATEHADDQIRVLVVGKYDRRTFDRLS